MLITRKSPVTGKENTMDLPITEEQYKSWENGIVAQRAFPNLNADQREFLISGMTPEDWDSVFGDEENEVTDYDEPAF